MRIGTGQSSGMGDILLLTAICKHFPDCDVELLTGLERFGRFFEGQSKSITYTDHPVDLPNLGNGHYAKCKLNSVGLRNHCYLPHVVVSEEERAVGEELIEYRESVMALVANTSPKWKEQREVSTEYWENFVRLIKEERDVTVLQFGVSSNFTPIKGTIPIVDLSIQDLICAYSVIGEMASVDTGDRHLMLACGGISWVARRQTYKDHHRWTYNSDRDKTLIYV